MYKIKIKLIVVLVLLLNSINHCCAHDCIAKIGATIDSLLLSDKWLGNRTMSINGKKYIFIETMRSIAPDAFVDYPGIFNGWNDKSKIISKGDIMNLRIWFNNNSDILSLFLFEDALYNAEIHQISPEGLFLDFSSQSPVDNMSNRVKFRIKNRVKSPVTDSLSMSYVKDNITKIQNLFRGDRDGYVVELKLLGKLQQFVYVMSEISGEVFYDRNTFVITREQFEFLKDWCYCYASTIKYDEIKCTSNKFLLEFFEIEDEQHNWLKDAPFNNWWYYD